MRNQKLLNLVINVADYLNTTVDNVEFNTTRNEDKLYNGYYYSSPNCGYITIDENFNFTKDLKVLTIFGNDNKNIFGVDVWLENGKISYTREGIIRKEKYNAEQMEKYLKSVIDGLKEDNELNQVA